MATYQKKLGIREAINLYRLNYQDIDGKVAKIIEETKELSDLIEGFLEKPIHNLDILEIGPGQRTPNRYYFAGKNRYIGIDIESNEGSNPISAFIFALKNSGVKRAFKTLVRKSLGLDRAYEKTFLKAVNSDKAGGQLICMDASKLQFADSTFDLIISVSVFEHISDLKSVMSEMHRVMRPGAGFCILTHIYTSDSGAHDPRLYGGSRDLPFWAHLRPQFKDVVNPNCYVNELRLADYKELFSNNFPGVNFKNFWNSSLEQELKTLRASGELSEYSNEELLTDVLCAYWKKPDCSSSANMAQI
jgi:SAM-dependent methyltransferase